MLLQQHNQFLEVEFLPIFRLNYGRNDLYPFQLPLLPRLHHGK
jgi:hypothetical protein